MKNKEQLYMRLLYWLILFLGVFGAAVALGLVL